MHGQDPDLWWVDDDEDWDAPVDYKQPYDEQDDHLCPHCNGTGVARPRGFCEHCDNGYVGVAYSTPTMHPPGSPQRIAVYAARSAAGLELWNEHDVGAR